MRRSFVPMSQIATDIRYQYRSDTNNSNSDGGGGTAAAATVVAGSVY